MCVHFDGDLVVGGFFEIVSDQIHFQSFFPLNEHLFPAVVFEIFNCHSIAFSYP